MSISQDIKRLNDKLSHLAVTVKKSPKTINQSNIKWRCKVMIKDNNSNQFHYTELDHLLDLEYTNRNDENLLISYISRLFK